jgi:hypothetical protein
MIWITTIIGSITAQIFQDEGFCVYSLWLYGWPNPLDLNMIKTNGSVEGAVRYANALNPNSKIKVKFQTTERTMRRSRGKSTNGDRFLYPSEGWQLNKIPSKLAGRHWCSWEVKRSQGGVGTEHFEEKIFRSSLMDYRWTTSLCSHLVKPQERKDGRVQLLWWLNLWRKRQPYIHGGQGCLGRNASWTWGTPVTHFSHLTHVWHICVSCLIPLRLTPRDLVCSPFCNIWPWAIVVSGGRQSMPRVSRTRELVDGKLLVQIGEARSRCYHKSNR